MGYCSRLGFMGVVGAFSAIGVCAQAADKGAAASGGLEEIVVTATRREQRLQEVPISVTAFSPEKLDAQGLKNIDDLSRLSPGVTFSRNGMGSSANYNDEGSDINIRGVDSTAGTSTTGVYIDDTPIQTRHIGFGSVNPYPQLFDVERVEVLRGPQGTLFGAGAEGGVVRFIAPDPVLNKPAGYARADLSTTKSGSPSYEAGAAVSVPIIDEVLALRISASFRRDGGWVDRVGYSLSPNALAPTPTPVFDGNIRERNSNWQRTSTLRVALKWKISDTFEIMPSLYYQQLHINDTAAYWIALSDANSTTFRNGNAGDNPSTDPFTLSAVKLKWDLGFASLISNTSYMSRDQHSTSDYTQYLRATWNYFGQLPNTFAMPGDRGYAPFSDTQRNFYQEIRLASSDINARVVWNMGLFYSHLDENVAEDIIDPTLDAEVIAFTAGAASVCSAALPCPNGLIFHGPLNRVVDKQIAGFGEVVFKMTDALKATLGLRVSKIDFTGSTNQTGPFLGETIVTSSSATEKPVTPKVVVAWQANRDNLLYVSASKGFRPGGVNIGVGGICGPNLLTLGLPEVNGKRQVPGQFSSDSLWSYEIGSKNTFLDNTLQINASVFYVDWSNIQQNVYLPICGEQFAANLGKARSRGGDLEVVYKPVESLTLGFTAAYVDARFTKSSCAGVLAFNGTTCSGTDPTTGGAISAAPIASRGDALLGAPWSLTVSGEYHFPAWAERLPYVRVDYQHTTAQKSSLNAQNTNNALFDQTIPGLPVTRNLSLRAGVRFSGFDLSVYGNNLSNSQPLLFVSRDLAAGPGVTPTDLLYFGRSVRPLTVGMTAIYRY